MPRAIWLLGLVSLFMDVSSELIHSLLPLFLVGPLGVSVQTVGLIEGVAEATALIAKVFSGALSDRWRQRKRLAVLGYALGAVTKPVFALATGAGAVVAARFVDRIGKGIRGAPRDALMADVTPPGQRGAAFGLHQALDVSGAVIGPLLATLLMLALADDFRTVFWIAVLPGALSVALLAFGLREPEARSASAPRAAPGWSRDTLARLWQATGPVVVLGAVFTLARFSPAFLVLRAGQAGVPVALVPLLVVAMNAVQAAASYPAGRWSDRIGPARLLGAGMACLVASDLALALAGHWAAVLAGVALWGLHLGLTQGLLAAMVADRAPADLRGSAFGLFNLVSGVAMLAASALAGWCWDHLGPAATFVAGAACAAAAGAALAWQAGGRAGRQ
ncbi:MAG: MFS transporter [Burkholderiaceae bacterium]